MKICWHMTLFDLCSSKDFPSFSSARQFLAIFSCTYRRTGRCRHRELQLSCGRRLQFSGRDGISTLVVLTWDEHLLLIPFIIYETIFLTVITISHQISHFSHRKCFSPNFSLFSSYMVPVLMSTKSEK